MSQSILILLFILMMNVSAKSDFKLRGSNQFNELRLLIQYKKWYKNLEGFNLKRRDSAKSSWEKKNIELIRPSVEKNALVSKQIFDSSLIENYKNKFQNKLSSFRFYITADEMIAKLLQASKRQFRGEYIRVKEDFIKAMTFGIGFVDKSCDPGTEYGLFGVFKGKESKKPLSVYTCQDQSKWNWEGMGQNFKTLTNRIKINTTLKTDWYLNRELQQQKVYLKVGNEQRLIGSMYPLAHNPEYTAYIMTDTNKIFAKEMEYTFEFYNNLGHLVHTKKVIKDLRPDLRGKILAGKLETPNRDGHLLTFDYLQGNYKKQLPYIKKTELFIIDTLNNDTLYKNVLYMIPYLEKGSHKHYVNLNEIRQPLVPTTLSIFIRTTSKNDRTLRTKPHYFEFTPITPITLDTFYFQNDILHYKLSGTADRYVLSEGWNNKHYLEPDEEGFYKISIKNKGREQKKSIWGFTKNIPSTDTLRFTFKVPDVGDPKGLFQSKVFGNNHFIKLRHLQGEIFKKALFKHLEFRQYLGDSLIATRQSQGNPGDKEFAVVFDNIQDTLTYQYSAVIRYDHNYYQETQPSRRHKLKSKHKFLQAKDSEIISWEWRDENYGAPSLLILPKINETFPGGDGNAMIAVNANGKILETFKSIQYVPDVGFKFQPYHRSYDGDSVKVSFYFKNTDGVWVDPGVTRQVLMRFRKGIPTGYKLKSQDGVLSWKTLERDAMQGKWEIFHRGEKVATTSTKSWTIPDKYNKPGSIFQVQAITTFGGVSPLSKPFVLGE